ncbi:putative glycosyltransferase EpsJ [Vibrio ruber DSM 16370]|uniref:Putative glycosyltransferase EpsJ n=1 Tax=Vibrio ruber (strain DSM 16370 / JCM 11486 / BCRC 17186 / CECT 7878 / LMG 23124 / VR1) TaxID=1123498 RepID=A0A1R4LC05_VIBR1|nr:glycosyltransferase family A protein [Vibrio ruber]SJN53949.1 putative glycosyltransferase EpsJ [Vibrio ruber DSM 16370]
MEISIIIPAYNAAETLPETLQSIFASSPGDDGHFEVIVIDDGSSDTTQAQLEARFAPQLRTGSLCYHYQQNAGVSVARNTGLNLAQGRYITFVDADDAVQHDYLIRLCELIQQYPDVDIFEFGYQTFRHQVETVLGTGHVTHCRGLNSQPQAFEGAVSSFVWLVMCRLIKADVARRAAFPAGVKYCEDLMYLCAVYAQAQSCYASELALYRYRIGETSAISRVTMAQCQQVRDFLDAHVFSVSLKENGTDNTDTAHLKKIVDANLYYMCHSAGKRTMSFFDFCRQVKRQSVLTICRLYKQGLLSRRKTMICLFPSIYFFGHRMKRR